MPGATPSPAAASVLLPRGLDALAELIAEAKALGWPGLHVLPVLVATDAALNIVLAAAEHMPDAFAAERDVELPGTMAHLHTLIAVGLPDALSADDLSDMLTDAMEREVRAGHVLIGQVLRVA
jgi:hypothetical protein